MKRRLPLLALGLLLCAGLAWLGTWQLQRARQKEALLADVQSVLAQRQPQPIQRAPASGYAWVTTTGRFLDAPVLMLDNQRRGREVGVRVLLPFQPDAGQALLVDLGWLPLPADRRLPEPVLPAGRHALAGLLAPPPAAGLAMGADHAVHGSRWLLTRVDLPALSVASKLALAPRILRLDPALPIGFARDLDVLPNTLPPERHRGYALQWFGLSATLLALILFLALRPRP